jgi:mxaK protein
MIWGVLYICLLSGLTTLWNIYQTHRENQWLFELNNGHDIPLDRLTNSGFQLRLARAVYLHQKQRYNEALDTLSLITEQGNSEQQAQSLYNLGNVYLTMAMIEVEAGRINQALPLLGLTKQVYRKALALDSHFWDAKYNLELAMRLLPEFDRISQSDTEEKSVRPSQLWTTVPGFPRGLP